MVWARLGVKSRKKSRRIQETEVSFSSEPKSDAGNTKTHETSSSSAKSQSSGNYV